MGRIQYTRRLGKPISDLVSHPVQSPATFHSKQVASSTSIHSSNTLLCKNPFFLYKEPFFSDTGISFAPHSLILQAGFHKSLQFLEKTDFSVEQTTNETSSPSGKNIFSDDADKIVGLLSNIPISNIGSYLQDSGFKISSELSAEVLKKLSNAGMVALVFFRWAETQKGFMYTTDIFHHLIDALGKIKQYRLIWSLVESMKQKCLLKKETFRLICRRYARLRKIKEAVEVFEKMEKFGLMPDSVDYNSLIDTIAKSKNVIRAQEILSNLKRRKKFSPDLKTYTILIEGWGQEKNLARTQAVYDEMIKEKFKPDVVTYGILINAFCKSGNYDEALKLFHSMNKSGCSPSPHIYCTLINGLGSDKRLEEALKYFELSKASGHPAETPTYNAVVGSYCKALRFEDAFRVVEEMVDLGIGPNARTFDVILHHLIKAGRPEVAYKVFEDMSSYKDCSPQLNTYTMMISMLCTEERVDNALKVWKEMNEKGVLPCMHMFAALINGLCYENRMEEACKFFEEMLDKGIRPSGLLFSRLKETLLEGGQNDLALMMCLKLDKLRKTPLNG